MINNSKSKLPETQTIIEDVVNELSKNKSVDAIMLFGSYAKGKVKPYSDIDFCIITERHIDIGGKADISSCSSDKIDISIFWDLPLVIQFRVLKEGKLLYCKDEMSLHRIKVSIIREYLDFQHILERYIRRVFTDT